MFRWCLFAVLTLPFVIGTAGHAADDSLPKQAAASLARATDFFTIKVSSHGGYLWLYSEDLTRREGEGRATAKTVWVQPPGTPSIGMVWLDAFEATADPRYLAAAKQTGMCLVRGQLHSGGWDYRIEFEPKLRSRHAYRVDGPADKKRNVTTFDDNTTQHAMRFLMRFDQTLAFSDATIHEAVEYALAAFLKAQFPNGGWPQRYDSFPDPADFPIKRASYPESWSRTHPGKNYRTFYTFNDNAIADLIDVMFIAERTYKDQRYHQTARKAGDFILLAQMPEPQPAWAQQYDADMHPAWARKFEPPSVTGGESQGILRTLLRLYRDTGDRKYLEPIPRAVAYLKRSEIGKGRLARFYELKTNKPLYFTKGDYQLTYDDGNLPTHYGFKVDARLDRIEHELQRLSRLTPAELQRRSQPSPPRVTNGLEAQVRAVIRSLDSHGRWVDDGRLKYHGDDDNTTRIISCRTFAANVGVLSRYLAAVRAESR